MSASMKVANRSLARNIYLLCLRKNFPSTAPKQQCLCKLRVVSAIPHFDHGRLYCTENKKNGQELDNDNQQKESFEAGPTELKETEKETEKEAEYEHGVRERILTASLKHVLELGWSQQAIEAGASEEGLSEAANGMFEKGGADIVSHLYKKCNRDLVQHMKQELERIKAEGHEKPKTRQFIQDAVETRLKMNIPYHSIWKEAMAIEALPQNVPESLKNLSDLCDDIWHYAGDKSTDFDWYTKRLSLGAVYEATEIYMLQDKSPEFVDTFAFLAKRLNDLDNLGSLRRSLGPIAEGLIGLIKMGRNMMGANSRNR